MNRLEIYQKAEHGDIFAQGKVMNHPLMLYMTRDNIGSLLHRIAVKGQGNNWAIYMGWNGTPVEQIRTNGDKAYDMEHVRRLLNADKERDSEFLSLYRR